MRKPDYGTPFERLNRCLAELDSRSGAWAGLPSPEALTEDWARRVILAFALIAGDALGECMPDTFRGMTDGERDIIAGRWAHLARDEVVLAAARLLGIR